MQNLIGCIDSRLADYIIDVNHSRIRMAIPMAFTIYRVCDYMDVIVVCGLCVVFGHRMHVEIERESVAYIVCNGTA